jgi:hypothetical protein
VSIAGRVPVPSEIVDENKRRAAERSLDYMGLKGGEKITDIKLDRVFIGSCTNGRIEDLREAAKIVEHELKKGRKVPSHVGAMVVPGSGLVKVQAESEGLDKIFLAAGLANADDKQEAIKKDLKVFEGKWKMEKMESGGDPSGQADRMGVLFDGNEYTFTFDGLVLTGRPVF